MFSNFVLNSRKNTLKIQYDYIIIIIIIIIVHRVQYKQPNNSA